MNQDDLDSKRSLVLLADDDPVICQAACAVLEQNGLRVSVAKDGARALLMIEQEVPDLICLDVQMPGLDGFSVCEKIRANRKTRHTPILMMTGLDDDESIDRAYQAGATDFVPKPVQWALLGHRVRYLLRAARRAQELWRSEQRLADAHRIAHLGNWEYDLATGELSCWGEIQSLFGLEAKDHLASVLPIFERLHDEDKQPLLECLKECRDRGTPRSVESRVRMADGTWCVIQTEIHAAFDEEGEIVQLKGTSQDVTRRWHAEDEIRHLAFHDGLTGLPNRRLFQELAGQAVKQARRGTRKLGILYLDLDNFKRINDTLGHEFGDRLLERVSERLSGSVRGGDCVARPLDGNDEAPVARLGGDEFVVFLTQLRDPRDMAIVAQRILDQLARSFLLGEQEVVLGASMGISVCPDDGITVDVLLRNADLAMHRAKTEGKNRYRFYTEAMNVDAHRRLHLESRLRKAVEAEALQLHYQPQVCTASGRAIGAEALLRWNDPDLGVVRPDEFIPVAEETGLISPLGESVLRRACAQIRRWIDKGFDLERVSINVSACQFQDPNLAETLHRALQENGLPGRRLEVEITESVLMSDEDRVVAMLKEMRDLGVQVAIDDFGTGYSSLRYLRELPVDRVKIDRSFLRDVGADSSADELVAAILSMCRALRLGTVGEGVETPEQLDLLKRHGCDEYQGFLFSPAVPAQELEELLARRSGG